MHVLARRALLLMVSLSLIASIVSPGAVATVPASGLEAALASHPVIRINSDAELASAVASGSGTEGDPFVIEGYDIDAAGGGAGIFIGNTTAHLVIRDCCLHGAATESDPFRPGAGIALYNATKVALENNTCRTNDFGIWMLGSNRNLIAGNTCNDNACWGVYLDESDGCVVANNTCSGNYCGLYLERSQNITVAGNSCYGNIDDIIVYKTSHSVIDGNLCTTSIYGVYLVETVETVLSNNTFDENTYGIALSSLSHRNNIVNNTVRGSFSYGIFVGSASDNLICGNELVGNNGASSIHDPSHVQAYDEGANVWNTAAYGNAWSDWDLPDCNYDGTVDRPYPIDGGMNVDNLPLAACARVAITSPMDGAVTNSPSVLVTGTANRHCYLEVNGVMVNVRSNGTFSLVVPLLEGANRIEATSWNLLTTSSASVTVSYVNQLREDLEEAQRSASENETRLQDEIDSLSSRLNLTASQLDEAYDLLNATRAWLQGVSDALDECYDAHNATADEVAEMLVEVQAIKTSLVSLRSSLVLTDGNVTSLAIRLDETIADLSAIEAALQAEIEAANDRIDEVHEALNSTRAWLASVDATLADCFDAGNATAGQVADMLTQVQAMRASLVSLRASLSSTDANITVLAGDLDDLIAELTTAEVSLTEVQTSLKATEKDVSALKGDTLPLALGSVGVVLGMVAVAIAVLTYTRRDKTAK